MAAPGSDCCSADYLFDANAEKQARINLQSREIQLIQAKIDMLTLAGKPLFIK